MICFRSMIGRLVAPLAGGIASAILAAAAPAAAQGDLLVAPTRLILDGRGNNAERGNAQIILSNIGDKEATYRISAELRRMTPQGELVVVEDGLANETEKASLEMVRFTPRRVVLPPGQPQAIRVSARPAADLPDGEYRIHMSFNGLPEVAPVAPQGSDAPAEGLSIRLIPIYSISIPIIVRKGNVEASATIANPRLEQRDDGPGQFLKLDMTRTGNGSVFGEIRAFQPGVADPVFYVRGIAVYPEIDHRELRLPVTPEQAAVLKGNLRFEYRELTENGGALLASTEGVVG